MRLQIAFGFFYFSVLVVITSWSYRVSQFHWVKSDNDEVMCATSPPNKTLHAIISRVHCVSTCNHGCPTPPCQAINYWKKRHIKSPLCVNVQSWMSISSLSGHQLLEETSYQESTVCQRAIMDVYLLPVRPSTTGRTVISRVHCVSSCNHGCPSPPCQAINFWKNRHESTVCQRAIMVVHHLPVRPSTTGRNVISRVHCVSTCNHGCPSPPCQAINYWKNTQLCQQFYYRPRSFDVQQDCQHFQVTGTKFWRFKNGNRAQ